MKAILTLALLLICTTTSFSQDFWERSGIDTVVRPIIIARDGNIIAGSFDGIFKSYDGGITWERKSQGGQFTFFISFAMNNEGHIFASRHSNVLLVSMDDGETWNTQRYIPGYDPDPLYYHPSGRLFGAPYQKGLYYSDDDGMSWTKVTSLDDMADTLEFFNVWDIADDNDGTIYIGTNEYAFKSTDIGDTWEQLIFSDECKDAYTIEAANNGDVYIGSKGWRCGLFKSTDGGAAWEQVNDGFDVMRYIQVEDILCVENDDIIVATNFDGVYRSKNDGKSWHKLSGGFDDEDATWTVFADKKGILFAGKVNGLFRSKEIAVSVADDSTYKDSYSLYYDPASELIKLFFTLQKPTDVTLKLFDIKGRCIYSNDLGLKNSGTQEYNINLNSHLTGVHFLIIQQENKIQIKKIMIE